MTHSIGKRQAMLVHMIELVQQNPSIKIAYYATANEVADKEYLARLKEALPGIDIIEVTTIGKGSNYMVATGEFGDSWVKSIFDMTAEEKHKWLYADWSLSDEFDPNLYLQQFGRAKRSSVEYKERPEHKKDYRKFDRKTYRKDRY